MEWVDARFNVDAGNNDEFVASLLPDTVGTYDYAYRYSTTDGREWVYADLDGIQNGYSSAQAGSLTVTPPGDTTPPASPTGPARRQRVADRRRAGVDRGRRRPDAVRVRGAARRRRRRPYPCSRW